MDAVLKDIQYQPVDGVGAGDGWPKHCCNGAVEGESTLCFTAMYYTAFVSCLSALHGALAILT